ncbi:MAG: hypothetical protein AAFX09_05015 [Pseudomonadota bacterium]
MFITLVALSLQSAVFSEPAGRYVAEAATGQCQLVLGEPGRTAPGSLVTPDAVSGLAYARPGCSLALREAALWRLERDEAGVEHLSLFDLAGQPVWAGETAESGWRGTGPDGQAVSLRRGR